MAPCLTAGAIFDYPAYLERLIMAEQASTNFAAPWAAGTAPAPTETSTPATQAPEATVVTQATSTETAPPAPETQASEAPQPDPQIPVEAKPLEQAEVSEVLVTVTVPKAFKLRVDNDVVIDYRAGVQEMPVEHAEHWYAKANGVEVYRPAK